MPTQPPPGTTLPEGWTYHVLNGRPFYYHAATNTTRQDIPSTGSFEMTANEIPMYPHAIAPQLPVPPPQEQAQPQVEPEPPMPQAARQAMTMAVQQPVVTLTVPEPVSFSMATPPASPRQEEQRRIDPLLGGRKVTFTEFAQAHQGLDDAQLAGIWAQLHPVKEAPPPPPAAQALQPSPRPAQPSPPTPNAQPMAQLQVLVPEPGLRAGQQLAFTAPAAGPGMSPTPMTVTVNQEVVPGSIVTVQYPRPQAPSAAPQSMPAGSVQRLPQPEVQVNADEDRRQSGMLWMLYGGGWICLCCIPPVTLVLWLGAICLYFCKPAPTRAQYRQTRVPALTVAITCLVCTILGLVAIPVAVFAGEMHGPHGHHGSHHEWHFGPAGHHPHKGSHHHGPCPMKSWFHSQGSHFLVPHVHFSGNVDNNLNKELQKMNSKAQVKLTNAVQKASEAAKEGNFKEAVETVMGMQKFTQELAHPPQHIQAEKDEAFKNTGEPEKAVVI